MTLPIRPSILGVGLLLALSSIACRGPLSSGEGDPAPGPVSPAVVVPLSHGVESNARSYYVSYEPRPDPIPLNEPFTLEVQVLDGRQKKAAVADIRLEVSASMPEHRHGMNRRPTVLSQGAGRFTVSGMLFHMPGRWQLYFDVTRGAITERAQLTIDLE